VLGCALNKAGSVLNWTEEFHDLPDRKRDLPSNKHRPSRVVFYISEKLCTLKNSNLNFFDFVVNSQILFKTCEVLEASFEIQEAICAGARALAAILFGAFGFALVTKLA